MLVCGTCYTTEGSVTL